jgi:ABC-type antimicrobial peptide transport system permease subunit
MARTIIGVIVGYVLMFILNFMAFVALYAVMGPERAFAPRLYLASTAWIGATAVILLVTGIIAGLVCALIAKGGRASLALAVVVVVLGLLLAIPAMLKANVNSKLVRPGDVPSMQAAQLAYWPLWCPFTFPFISALGVVVGGKLKRGS